MPIVDLTHLDRSLREPEDLGQPDRLAAAPRRIGLTLPELLEAARLAGDAPLPFEVGDAPTPGDMERRIGGSSATTEDAAYRSVLDALPDAATNLAVRALVTDGVLDAGVAGALGLIGAPAVAIDVDVALPDTRLRVWHRQAGEAVATLATADGIVFELGWYAAEAWPAELARAVTLPEELSGDRSGVPAYLDLPLGLAEAAADAVGAGRTDVLDVLMARGDRCLGADGPLDTAQARSAVLAACQEARGRMRALVARTPAGGPPQTIGVVSWTLVADGWRHLRPYRSSDGPRIALEPAEPADLAALLAPTLAAAR